MVYEFILFYLTFQEAYLLFRAIGHTRGREDFAFRMTVWLGPDGRGKRLLARTSDARPSRAFEAQTASESLRPVNNRPQASPLHRQPLQVVAAGLEQVDAHLDEDVLHAGGFGFAEQLLPVHGTLSERHRSLQLRRVVGEVQRLEAAGIFAEVGHGLVIMIRSPSLYGTRASKTFRPRAGS